MDKFVKEFTSHWYNDAYCFGRVNVTCCFLFPSEAIPARYSITGVPVLDDAKEKVHGWFLAQKRARVCLCPSGIGERYERTCWIVSDNRKEALAIARSALARISTAGGAVCDARDKIFKISLRSTDDVDQYRKIEKLCLAVSDANKAINVVVRQLNNAIDEMSD